MHKKCNIQLYDKRDDFPFSIVKMPHFKSNIHSKMFYFVFGGQILRTTRFTSKCETYCQGSENLMSRMAWQGRDKCFYMGID